MFFKNKRNAKYDEQKYLNLKKQIEDNERNAATTEQIKQIFGIKKINRKIQQ